MLDKHKVEATARLIEGRVVEGELPMAVFIRGNVLGFPAIFQALRETWPFGVTYIIETTVVDDPAAAKSTGELTMTIMHRNAKGPLRSILRLFLMEARGIAVGDKRMQDRYLVNSNNAAQADRFMRYPGVFDALLKLEEMTKFNEINIRTNAGISLSQPQSFASLDLDICKETFRTLGELGQIVFEAF